MYGSKRLTRSFLYGMTPSVQRDMEWRNWAKDSFGKDVDGKLTPESCRAYRASWEDFLMAHEGAMELPASIERKKISKFTNHYFRLADEP
eukprot:TRINITY_DN2101_c1_g1_i1.p1 TRINITY_DN2101_c1_g1~~TRINITY_DN2101_c1_g1_i1.p1  ORF type:complete len:103 (+),score=38.25 TRINITY_DN2101_c1_g1_i1:40-309(+)